MYIIFKMDIIIIYILKVLALNITKTKIKKLRGSVMNYE